ncbi:MAG: BamA/TamA family outer membrane protein [Bacteroidota bacterium]
MRPWSILAGLMLCLLGSSCSLQRTLPEGEYLYTGAKIKVVPTEKGFATTKLSASYAGLLKQPKPNGKFLGLRWGLRLHNLFHSERGNKFWAWCQRKLGKPPVIYQRQVTEQTQQILANRAFNQGFFEVQVKAEVKQKKRKASVLYLVSVRPPHRISALRNAVSDSVIHRSIDAIQDSSLLRPGEAYQLDLLKRERERITTALRRRGHYLFRSDYLKFRADTLGGGREVQLELVLKPNVDSTHLPRQTIRQIVVYPDLDFDKNRPQARDTLQYDGLTILSSRELLRPAALREAILLRAGQYYSTTDHRATLERLSFLQTYQFVEVQFEAAPQSDSLLDVRIKLRPRQLKTVEGSVGGSLSAGLYAGPEITATYLDRNLFRGAERLRVSFNGQYNFPLVANIASRVQQEIQLALSKPGLIVPFRKRAWPKALVGQTKASFSYSIDRISIPLNGTEDFLREENFTELLAGLRTDPNFAPAVTFNTFDWKLSYLWRRRPAIQHELTPISVVWQAPQYQVDELRRLLVQIFLLDEVAAEDGFFLSLEPMLLYQPAYVYLFDSRLKQWQTHNFYYRGRMAFAANRLLNRDSNIVRANDESQFLQWENDWRYFWRPSAKHTLAGRLAAQFSFPLGEELLLPFFDLYAVGGPNSIRAFPPRRVGPGSVEPTDQTFFFSGTGDLLLEGSLEWRPRISSLLELGFFVDAGNVWLFRGGTRNDELATFRLEDFYRQLAVGTGFGLRFDFQVLLLRTDFGFPLTRPWLPQGQRWVGDRLQLRDAVFNLAFGYAF